MRVHDLRGADLDLWTANAAGAPDPQIVNGVCVIAARRGSQINYQPSSSWAEGGAIIESERISVWRYPNLDSWHACMEFDVLRDEGLMAKHYYQGPTPLIAAMRCFIASKFGNEVPQELGA
jgi:hypothetical protein